MKSYIIYQFNKNSISRLELIHNFLFLLKLQSIIFLKKKKKILQSIIVPLISQNLESIEQYTPLITKPK